MIKMGLVRLPFDSGDQVCFGNLAVGEKFVFFLIIVVMFIGLGRAYRLEGILKLSSGWQVAKGWDHFYGGS